MQMRYMLVMKENGRSLAFAALLAAGLSMVACNRDAGSKTVQAATAPKYSGQAVTGATVRPGPAQPQPSVPAPVPSAIIPATASSQVQAAKSDAAPPKVVVTDHNQTLVVAGQNFRFLSRVQSIPGTTDETVEWWELRNQNDRVMYHQSYPINFQGGSFENTTQVGAQAFTTSQGSGILIEGMDLPSAPDSGGWIQLFGYKYGRDKYGVDENLFGPFGPPISIQGDFLEVGTDSFRPSFGATALVVRDVLKFRLWTGNFNITYPVQINWVTGKLQPAWRCLESTTKGRVERCSYPITVDAHREAEATFVRLFQEPDEGFTPKHVIVQPQSKVEYLESRMPVAWSEDNTAISFSVNGDVWIKVRIDGAEGWIHSEEDLEAVGLPQSG